MVAALASLVTQSWPLHRLEAVVVDNGSTDATSERVRRFAAANPSLRTRLVGLPTRGRSKAKNAGACAAGGHLLLFLDADSRAAPDLVERVVARARDGCPAASIRVVADSDDPLDLQFFRLFEFGKALFRIRAQMFFCERDLFLALGGFDERLEIAEDRDLLVRIERSGRTVCSLTESWIATSPRRLHELPLRLGMLRMFGRWALAHAGIGRTWRY